MGFVLHRLTERRIWERLLRERFSEPLHLHLVAGAVWLFGSLRAKIYCDLITRQQHAFSLLNAADKAKALGLSSVTAVEFGVANGAGLLNICWIAKRVQDATGITFQILGFDSGGGMPPPRDYRDHPEYYNTGDFPMQDQKQLQKLLFDNAKLLLGDLSTTVTEALTRITQKAPLGFMSIDVDYYHSTTQA